MSRIFQYRPKFHSYKIRCFVKYLHLIWFLYPCKTFHIEESTIWVKQQQILARPFISFSGLDNLATGVFKVQVEALTGYVGTHRWPGLSPCFDLTGEIRWKPVCHKGTAKDLVSALCISHWLFPASLWGSVWKVRNYFIHLTLSLNIYVQNNPLDKMFLKNWLLADLIKSMSLSSLGEFPTSSVEYCGGQ